MISNLLLLALGAKLALELAKGIYNVFFHPLRSVPGPWYAAISDLWLSWNIFLFKQTPTIQELLEKYGPVVRIAPNKVIFRDQEAVRDVYLVRKFDKSPMYKNFKIEGIDHALTMLDNPSHAALRKLSGPHYSASNVGQLQPEIHKVSNQLLDALDFVDGKVSVNCMDLMKNYMADIIVFSNFGYHLRAMENWTPTNTNQFCVSISDFPKFGIVQSFFPDAIWQILCRIPNQRWKQFTRCVQIISAFVTARIHDVEHQMKEKTEFEISPLVHRLLLLHPSSLPEDRNIVRTEGFSHLIAGTETTSTALSYFFWQLSCSPDILRRLQSEVDLAMPDRRAIPDLSVLQSLPYLNAFISEGLRLYGSVPSFLERVVPQGAPYQLLGHTIPPGTIIGTQAWSMHRDPDLFPEPHVFKPDRWLDDSLKDRAAKSLMPFGIGPRICAGQILAQAVLRVAVATVVRNFDVMADSETTKESMRIMHGFAVFPVSGVCKLTFVRRQEDY
ncbi:cytochrome P450 [Mycena amicta]|nr:cytochrome P450 [Mycena amicta]